MRKSGLTDALLRTGLLPEPLVRFGMRPLLARRPRPRPRSGGIKPVKGASDGGTEE